MKNILIILFSIVDCDVWRVDQLKSWADGIIAKSHRPSSWLVELSLCDSTDSALDVLRDAMKTFGVTLPDDLGDLLVGLTLLRFDRGDLSETDTRRLLIDIVDAYGANGVDPESIDKFDLKDPKYSGMRDEAQEALECLSRIGTIDRDSILVEA